MLTQLLLRRTSTAFETRLDDGSDEKLRLIDNDVESDLDQLIALKYGRIGGGILWDTFHRYVFFFLFFFFFILHNHLNFVLYSYSDPCVHRYSSRVCIE